MHSSGTLRESYLDWIQSRHPSFRPKNDFEILILASGNYRGSERGIRSWLDEQVKIHLLGAAAGDAEMEAGMDSESVDCYKQAFITRATAILNDPGAITGIKPKPYTRNVFCQPIPNSPYSIRLFPGSIAHREYCLDFVHTLTGEAINSPPGFEVWSVPDSRIPWLGAGMVRVRPLECSFGFTLDILPGAEKYLLRDGQECMLKRRGHRNLLFSIPVRAEGLARPDGDRLHFPDFV